MKALFGRKMMVLCIGSVLLMVTACAGRESKPETTATPEKAAPKEAAPAQPDKLSKNYAKAMCFAFDSAPQVAKDYPTAAGDVQQSMLTALGQKKVFKEVAMTKDGRADAQTLLVKATVSEVRIVSSAARIWGGPMAGSSYVNLDLQLIDGATKKTVRQEKLSTANNPFAAAWSSGSTDYSLLGDMGRILADYLAAVNPGK